MLNPSPVHLIMLLIVVLLVFGTKKLPEVARSLGSGLREFKGSISGHLDDEDDRFRIPTVDEPLVAAPATGPAEAERVLSHLSPREAVVAQQSTPAPTPELAMVQEVERSERPAA